MTWHTTRFVKLIVSYSIAFIFFTAIFGYHVVSFWAGMSVSTLILASLAVYWGGWPLLKKDLTTTSISLGILSTILLYSIFFLGNWISGMIFPFAQHQVSSIHMIRNESSPFLIAFILFFITSPCEELFWRGWVQKILMQRFTPMTGWLFGAIAYALVHIASGNFMLIMAALIAGLFWGGLYWKTKNLWICVISHALWTVSIFLLWPIGR